MTTNKWCDFPKTDEELRKLLSPEQYRIIRENGTELPFKNQFWNHAEAGIYVDLVSGEPLFSSKDQFDSGCGWPSFSKPIEPGHLVEKPDLSHGRVRVEVRSMNADSHLGHVFEDGPPPTHLRYCINSASLRFVPLEKMEHEGYGAYLSVFGKDYLSDPQFT